MVEARKNSLIKCFRFNIFILGIFGLYLPQIERKWIKLLYKFLVFFLQFFFLFLYFLLMILNVILNSNNLETLTEYLFFSLTAYASLVKVLYIALKRNELKALVSNLDADIFYPKNKKYLKKIEYGKKLFYKTSGLFFTACLIVLILLLFSPIIDSIVFGSKNRQPIELWYPFDIENYFTFAVVYVYHIISMMSVCWVTVAIDTFFYGFLSLAIGQLCVLNSSLENIISKERVLKNDEINYWKTLAHCTVHYKCITK